MPDLISRVRAAGVETTGKTRDLVGGFFQSMAEEEFERIISDRIQEAPPEVPNGRLQRPFVSLQTPFVRLPTGNGRPKTLLRCLFLPMRCRRGPLRCLFPRCGVCVGRCVVFSPDAVAGRAVAVISSTRAGGTSGLTAIPYRRGGRHNNSGGFSCLQFPRRAPLGFKQ